VCRQDEVKLFLGYGVHPTVDGTSARKYESVFAVAVDNGELHIAAERNGIYWLPVHNEFIRYLPRKNHSAPAHRANTMRTLMAM
jgi:hypothetical protein